MLLGEPEEPDQSVASTYVLAGLLDEMEVTRVQPCDLNTRDGLGGLGNIGGATEMVARVLADLPTVIVLQFLSDPFR